MSSFETIDYQPAPTVREFILDYAPGELFYDWIIGPYGSGKTTGNFMKLVYMAGLQKPQADGIKRTRCVVVRNTAPQLKDTTLVSWNYWFKPGQAGLWFATDKIFLLKFGDIECEVLFRPLDTPEDVARVLSLEVTFAIIDEFVQIPKQIIDALSARLGRFPSMKDGGATNWGMWGSSNPDTEDNWWYDFLHHSSSVARMRFKTDGSGEMEPMLAWSAETNAKFYVQPSALTPEAENIANLPGGRGYYDNQMKGKSHEWIKQFIECEWGYSIAGTPVVKSFKPAIHIVKKVQWNPGLKLVAGFDPGLAGSALIFGQQDMYGRLAVVGELVQSNIGVKRLMKERLKPFLKNNFPDCQLLIAPDPAANYRANSDEKTIVTILRDYYDVSVETNNRLPLRVDALDHFLTTLTDQGPAFLIDERVCPETVRALKGGWRFEMDTKRNMIKGVDPEKNQYSHTGDAAGYLARYFHKGMERELRYKHEPGSKRFTPPRSFGPRYNFS